MSSSFLIGVWASGFWQELGSPANLSALTVSGYACSTNTIGKLNDTIGTCYYASGASGASGIIGYNFDVAPDLGQEELAIIGAMYLVSYYNGLAQAAMGAGSFVVISNGGVPLQQIREGDSSVTWANVAAIGGNFAKMATEARKTLNYLCNNYINQIQQASVPRSINFLNVVYPQICGGYGGYGA
jgi:hypothetical protein